MMKTKSNIEKILESRGFCGDLGVWASEGGGCGGDTEEGELLKGVVDAVNVTDNQTSVVRMSSFSACIILKEMGFDPILQMVCRDRNRIAIQSDILGAGSLGDQQHPLSLGGSSEIWGSSEGEECL